MPFVVRSVSQRARDGQEVDGVGNAVILRIRKMLDRAENPTTPQAEADNAMRAAQRELDRYNLQRATVLMASDNLAEASSGAIWRVELASTADGRESIPVRWYVWLATLVWACNDAFHVKSYHGERKRSTQVTFYGMEHSAEAAARAFAAYFARCDAMTRAYQPDPAEHMRTLVARYNERVASGELNFMEAAEQVNEQRAQFMRTFVRQSRDSYRYGLATGLRDIFRQESRMERRRIEDLEVQADAERSRLRREAEHREALENWRHDEAAHIMQHLADGSAAAAAAAAELLPPDNDFDLDAADREIAACRALVVATGQVAERVLAAHSIRLNTAKRRAPWTFVSRNRDAFDEGKRDAKRLRREVVDDDGASDN